MNDICGNFKDISVAKLFSWLYNNRKTGVLRLSHGQQRKEFRLLQGEPFAFKSNFAAEQIEALLANKQISDLATLRNLRIQCRQMKKSFAREIINMGLLSKAEMELWMTQCLHLAIDNASRWSVGTFSFRPLSEDQIGKPFIISPQSDAGSDDAPTVESMLADETVFADIRQKITTGKVELPPLPTTLMKIRECLKDPDWDNQDLLKIIMTDQILTTSILKVANSSLYGLSSGVSSLQHAIVLMGMKTIWGIVTHQSLLSSFPKERNRVEEVLEHSFLCALLAKQMARQCHYDEEDAFTCGLLHDIGKVVLYNLLSAEQLSNSLEQRLVDRFHCEAGLLIAAKWNLPEVVLETIEHHHKPEQAEGSNGISEIVYAANCIANGCEPEARRLACLQFDRIDLQGLRQIKAEFTH